MLALPSLCEHLQAIDPEHEAEFYFNVLQEPRRYSIQILPQELKEEAKRRLEEFAEVYMSRPGRNIVAMREMIRPVISFMMFPNRPGKLREFSARTLELDEMRGQSTADIIPELAPFLVETPQRKYARKAKQAFGTFVNGVRQIATTK